MIDDLVKGSKAGGPRAYVRQNPRISAPVLKRAIWGLRYTMVRTNFMRCYLKVRILSVK
jgi:hypothetical protein